MTAWYALDLFAIISFAYLFLVILLLLGWEAIPLFYSGGVNEAAAFISVIISVRNEEDNIEKLLYDLSLQAYPAALFEVIVVDDFSTDRTRQITDKFKSKASFHLTTLTIDKQFEGLSNKKRAIALGVESSKGSIIVTTDGDCRVGKEWLSTLESFFRATSAQMVSGPVYIQSNGSLWSEMQRIEFSSLIGAGAACMNLGFPNMCNGANLAYRKEVFYEVNGFEGNEHIASGDDEFLMHKVSKKYPGKVRFLKSPDAIVSSPSLTELRAFLQQRRRWASKWSGYKAFSPKIVAVFIFLVNFSIVAGAFLSFCGLISPLVFFQQILLKIVAEFVFLRRILVLTGRKINFFAFLLLEMVYPFYVLIVAMGGLVKGYEWKGRRINN